MILYGLKNTCTHGEDTIDDYVLLKNKQWDVATKTDFLVSRG